MHLKSPLVMLPCRSIAFLLIILFFIPPSNSSSTTTSSTSKNSNEMARNARESVPNGSKSSSLMLQGPFSRSNSGSITVLSRKSGLAARFILRPTETRFALGFFSTSPGAYELAIYLYPLRNARHRRRVWCAADEHSDPIVVPEGAILQLGPRQGLVLTDSQGVQLWSADTSRSSRSSRRIMSGALELRLDGNLVLYDAEERTIWESFDHPVDVLLPGQMLTPGMKLVNGPYKLAMEHSGLALYGGDSQMWTWDTCRNKSCTRSGCAQFSIRGLHLVQSVPLENSCECSPGNYDPIKVLTGHSALALLLSDTGAIHVDVLCSGDPPPFRSRAKRLITKRHTYYLANSGKLPCSVCKDSICHCPEAQVDHVQNDEKNGGSNTIHSQAHWFGKPFIGRRALLSSISFRNHKYKATVALAGIFGAAVFGAIAAICSEKKQPAVKPQNAPIKDILPGIIPQKYSYSSIRKITENFRKQLGDGGFGGVYEGVLKDGTRVAVKVLEHSSTQGEKEFKAEMLTMATIRHVNILQLRGFCAEKKQRVLVYDFMPNGSLDRWLFSPPGKDGVLDWVKRYTIALGTAKGLAYLHEECNQQIIHLDVKPENILLDHNFVAKVADFGLSKLIDRDKSKVVTNMRGTPGYLAPEWMHQSSVTAKADVYSYGMVLLELICGRESIDLTKGSEQWYLPAWAVRMVEEGKTLELVDEFLQEEIEYFYSEEAKRSIRTALCCIQEDPTLRPGMSRVVQMLEGVVEPKLPKLSMLPIQPATAANKLKNKLDVLADAITEDDVFGIPLRHRSAEGGNNEVSFNAWGLSNGPVVGQTRTILRARNQPAIPPWPLKGDIVIVRGSGKGGEFAHAVIRDVKIRTQQVKLARLEKLEENRWQVMEEECMWRQWSVMLRTLEFWIAVKWTTLPGYGPQKFAIEWLSDASQQLQQVQQVQQQQVVSV